MSANPAAAAKAGADPSMEEILASIRRIIADDSLGTKKDEPVAKAPPAPEPEPAAEPDDPDADVLDLAEVGSVAMAPAAVEMEPEMPEPTFVAEPQAVAVDPMDDFMEPAAVDVGFDPPPAPPVASRAALENRIVSESTGALVSQAFQSLSRNMSVPQGRSLEDVVVDILRPMLAEWMDTHLPPIVERIVKAEIERVARGG